MKSAHRLEFYTDDGGKPWACFAWGNVDPSTLTRERIEEAAKYPVCHNPDDTGPDCGSIEAKAKFIKLDDDPPTDDLTYFFCRETDPGSIPITFVHFQ